MLGDKGRPKNPLFKWGDTALGNIKSAITGTCRSFDGQHTDRYRAAYEWRINRRFDLAENIERLPRSGFALVRRLAEVTG